MCVRHHLQSFLGRWVCLCRHLQSLLALQNARPSVHPAGGRNWRHMKKLHAALMRIRAGTLRGIALRRLGLQHLLCLWMFGRSPKPKPKPQCNQSGRSAAWALLLLFGASNAADPTIGCRRMCALASHTHLSPLSFSISPSLSLYIYICIYCVRN